MPNPFRVRRVRPNPAVARPAPQQVQAAARLPHNFFVNYAEVQEAGQQAAQNAALRGAHAAQIQEAEARINEALAGALNAAAVARKKAIVRRTTRATPTGRLKTIKLGDILKAYLRTDNRHQAKYEIIDFRPVEYGDYFLSKTFCIEMVDDQQVIVRLKASPRLIIERIKGSMKDEFLIQPEEEPHVRER